MKHLASFLSNFVRFVLDPSSEQHVQNGIELRALYQLGLLGVKDFDDELDVIRGACVVELQETVYLDVNIPVDHRLRFGPVDAHRQKYLVLQILIQRFDGVAIYSEVVHWDSEVLQIFLAQFVKVWVRGG